ncbi:MAG: VOC family protein [Gemmatimonadota bacterium]|jgi:hypothetical protein
MTDSTLLSRIDHLVYAVPDLQAGMDRVEALLGVRPVPGGRHPHYRTHNAILSLGDTTYLEVIAPDPSAAIPDRGMPLGLQDLTAERLATWAVRTERIMADAAAAASSGVGQVEAGSRQRADGTLLTWKLTDPYAMPFDGALPFLISWGDTPHPAASAPCAGTLASLHIEHPEAERVRDALTPLDLGVEVRHADAVRLVATIRTDQGTVVLT